MEPVIINQSFERNEINRLLSKFYKARVAEKTDRNSIIFPKSSRAFLIKPLCEFSIAWPPRGQHFLDQDAINGLKKFVRIHRYPFIFLLTNQMSAHEVMVYNKIQEQFDVNENVIFYPVSNHPKCVAIINDIIKPSIDRDSINMELKALKQGKLNEETITQTLMRNIPITDHDAMVVQDGCKCLSNIAKASKEELVDCSLSIKSAQQIQTFFQ
ncbi:uncharacterized protein [Clytia hemisphaerica]|uniref:Uncharacterized protein n=1 Tax=Clytia hemisphaerica TaxID=252671 RepID=A0A7M5V7X0_9CNID